MLTTDCTKHLLNLSTNKTESEKKMLLNFSFSVGINEYTNI